MSWWRRLWHRKRMEEQLEKELQFHLEAHAKELIAKGHDVQGAKREARMALGGVEQVKERCRDARGTRWFENLIRDLRYAMRVYRRSPGFTVTALLAIALGIGATTAVFSVSDRILFRRLSYLHDEQLASFGMLAKVVDDGEFLFAADYKDFVEANSPFQAVTSWSGVRDCDVALPDAVREHCAEVDFNFLSVLGISPILGEAFTKADVQPNAPRKVMIGYGLWRSRFGSDRHVVGRVLMLDGAPSRITGVLPKTFELPTLERAELLTPQTVLPAGWQHGATRVLRAIGRLKPGVSLESARAQLIPFFHHMLDYVPPQFRKEVQFEVRSIRDRQMGSASLAAWTLLGAALAVVLLSSTNVANLLLARAAGRQMELAIRRAMGISEGRLLCQMLTESVLLGITGGVIGCALGFALLRILVAADPAGIPHLSEALPDGRVLAFSMVLSVSSALLFGLAPLVVRQPSGVLRVASLGTTRSSAVLKQALVILQIALSIVLTTGAGLLVRTLWNLERQPLGMQRQHVITAQLVLPANRYTKVEQRIAFFNTVERQISAIPGIEAVGLSDSLPPGGWERSRPLFSIGVVGRARQGSGTGGMVNWRYVSPGYLESLRIPVLEGRLFQEADRRPGTNICLISRSLERRLFVGKSGVGQYLTFGTASPYEISGVVPDVKNTGLATADNPEYYILRTHSVDDTYLNISGGVAQRMLSVVVRSPVSDATLAPRLRQAIAAADGILPVDIKTMNERLGEMVAGPRLNARLLLIFAAVGLLLAATGLYGTISFLVAQRTREFGIRMSLGATPSGIASLIFSQSATWILAGSAIGVGASLASTKLLSSMLFRVPANDPTALLLSVTCLVLSASLAIASPVRQAARTNPSIALRNDN